ncbi:TetR/AcrR family transcriptional regulator [Nocardioides sp. Bht2]|uniref:TetR/AcrR family transcriptional regulator n=1 Tax=Nocardioides sp. Bht2 TaxID=3392297 RepID=UPI0039B4065C
MTQDRRTEILEHAADLFAERGVGATTVREIGERAGVLSGSLYHYFGSKDAIVAELLEAYMSDIQQRFAAAVAAATTPRETIDGLIAETLAVIDDHPRPTAIYQQDRRYLREHGLLEQVDAPSREMRSLWLDAIEAGVADGTFRDDVPAETFYRTVRDALWASRHWPNRGAYSRAEFTAQMSQIFLGGYLR